MYKKFLNIFVFGNKNYNIYRGLIFYIPVIIFIFSWLSSVIFKDNNIILRISLCVLTISLGLIILSIVSIKKADKINRERNRISLQRSLDRINAESHFRNMAAIRENMAAIREMMDIHLREIRSKPKEIKRIYSKEDPYGEENWEE